MFSQAEQPTAMSSQCILTKIGNILSLNVQAGVSVVLAAAVAVSSVTSAYAAPFDTGTGLIPLGEFSSRLASSPHA